MKVKKAFKIFSVCLILAMAFAISGSAAYNSVTLTKRMLYVSGSANSFTASQATYSGSTYYDSDCACMIGLYGTTANGNTKVHSTKVNVGSSIYAIGPFSASTYGVSSWYAYAQPTSSSGFGGHCVAQASSH